MVKLNRPKIIVKFLWNNFGALKIFSTVLCLYLILDLFQQYLFKKPTLTSTTRTFLTSKNFPVITLCHQEQIDKESLESNGFKNIFYYRTGMGDITYRNGTHQRVSWKGNGSKTVYEVHDEIPLLKSAIDCPKNSSFWFERKQNDLENNRVGRKRLSFKLTRALYPNHRCCKVNIQNLEDVNIIKAIRIADTTLNSNKNFSSYKLYLSDQISDSPFKLAKEFNLGDEMSITSKEIGLHKRYKVKVSQEHHVEDDPKYPCIKYHENGEYGECLEQEMIKNVQRQLNCTPPWVTDNKVKNQYQIFAIICRLL